MRDIVLVTTFFRPEFLWITLSAIAASDGGRDKDVWVVQDHHIDPKRCDAAHVQQIHENAEIVAEFCNKFQTFRWIDRLATNYAGNSYSCLEAYKEAYGTDARFVYLIEDDILIEKDFFRWHEAAQAQGDYFCSIGWDKPEAGSNPSPEAYTETSSGYTSWGVCWRREKLAEVVHHCRPEYYRSMEAYVHKLYPCMPWGCAEQDGLISGIVKSNPSHHVVIRPCLTRAYHIGVTGYHRPNGPRFTGNLRERVRQLSEAMWAGKLPEMRKEFLDLNDIDTPRTAGTPAWSTLHKAGGLPVQSLWVGDKLSTMEKMSIASFLQVGQPFHLYTYGPVDGVPDGAEMKFAGDIVPKSTIDRFQNLANFSDYFRYMMLLKNGGYWTDLDVFCLRLFDFKEPYVFATQDERHTVRQPVGDVTTCVIKAPADCDLLKYCLGRIAQMDTMKTPWAALGPSLLMEAVRHFSFQRYVKPSRIFCPVHYFDIGTNGLAPGPNPGPIMGPTSGRIVFGSDTHAVHMWNESNRRAGLDKNAVPPGSLYERLLRQLGRVPEIVPNTAAPATPTQLRNPRMPWFGTRS